MNEEEFEQFKFNVANANQWQLNLLSNGIDRFPKTFEKELVLVNARRDELNEQERERRAKLVAAQQERDTARKAALAIAQEAWDKDPDNQATVRGWLALKKITPNLDGVDNFHDLPPVLKYRYDAFRRAVEDKPQLKAEVKSNKQLAEELQVKYIHGTAYYADEESFE